jgi:phosphinothricin acetyltransferase
VLPYRGAKLLRVENLTIRAADTADARAIRDIYALVVETTAISFELVPPTVEEMSARISKVTAQFPWLVAEVGDSVVGYVYASAHSERAAYRWTVETSVYIEEGWRGRGLGGALYDELIGQLRELGYLVAIAGIALPNDASIAVHERVGFRRVGTLPSVGHKFGAWWDVGYWCLPIVDLLPVVPTEPRRWQRSRPTASE